MYSKSVEIYAGVDILSHHSLSLALNKCLCVSLFRAAQFSWTHSRSYAATAQNGLNLLLIMVTASIKVDDFF